MCEWSLRETIIASLLFSSGPNRFSLTVWERRSLKESSGFRGKGFVHHSIVNPKNLHPNPKPRFTETAFAVHRMGSLNMLSSGLGVRDLGVRA